MPFLFSWLGSLPQKSSRGLIQDLVYSLGYEVVSFFDVYLHQTAIIKATGAVGSPARDQDKALRTNTRAGRGQTKDGEGPGRGEGGSASTSKMRLEGLGDARGG